MRRGLAEATSESEDARPLRPTAGSHLAGDEEDFDGVGFDYEGPVGARPSKGERRTLLVCAVAVICTFFVGMEVGMIVAGDGGEGGVDSISKTAEAGALKERLIRGPNIPAIIKGSKGSRGQSGGGRSKPTWAPSGASSTPLYPPETEEDVIGRLREGKRAIAKARENLLNRYSGDAELLTSARFSPSESGDQIHLVAKMKRAMMHWKDEFIISVAGSSISAGHDNLGTDAWPIVLRNTLQPVWDALKTNFTVRNQAIGGRNPNPHTFCLAPMLGDDADVIIREWQYWMFHEGFEESKVIAPGMRDRIRVPNSNLPFPEEQAAGLEVFLRMALGLKAQPAVHLLFLQHAQNLHTQPLSYLKRWLHNNNGILKDYGNTNSFAINYFDAFGTPFDHLREKFGKPRWRKDLDERTHKKVPCSDDNVADCPVDFIKQDGYNEGTLFINWHPGRLGHRVMGDQFAYYYLGLMLDAVNDLIRDDKLSADKTEIERNSLPKQMPSPVACNPEICKYIPKCAYSYLPKAQGPDVGDWMVNKTESAWMNAPATNQATCSLESFYNEGCYAESRKNQENCRTCIQTRSYLDVKLGFRGSKSSGPITFSIPPSKQCLVWFCEPPYEWSKRIEIANWGEDIVAKVNDKLCSKENGCYSVHQTGYKQCAILNLKKIDSSCEAKENIVELQVEPASKVPDSGCRLIQNENENRCAFSGSWSGMEGEDRFCRREESTCVSSDQTRDVDVVYAFISEVIVM